MDVQADPADDPARLAYRSNAWELVNQVSLVKFLNHDARPAFILDLHDSDYRHLNGTPSRPIFINQALCKSNALFAVIGRTAPYEPGSPDFRALEDFLSWAWTSDDKLSASHLDFAAFSWSSVTLDDRWRVVVAAAPAAAPLQTTLSSSGGFDFDTNVRVYPTHEGPSATDESRRPHLIARDFFLEPLPEHSVDLADNQNATRRHPAFSTSYARLNARNVKRNDDLLAKIASFDALAIFFADVKGQIVFCNDAFYEMNQHSRDQLDAMEWVNIIEDEEVPRIMELWTRIITRQESIRYEVRIKRRWTPPAAFPDAPSDFPTWISGWAYPDVSPDGETIGVCGVMTDISEQKWTEHRTREALSHAEERARLMEQLSLTTKQVIDTENRFRRLSDMMPIAIWSKAPILLLSDSC